MNSSIELALPLSRVPEYHPLPVITFDAIEASRRVWRVITLESMYQDLPVEPPNYMDERIQEYLDRDFPVETAERMMLATWMQAEQWEHFDPWKSHDAMFSRKLFPVWAARASKWASANWAKLERWASHFNPPVPVEETRKAGSKVQYNGKGERSILAVIAVKVRASLLAAGVDQSWLDGKWRKYGVHDPAKASVMSLLKALDDGYRKLRAIEKGGLLEQWKTTPDWKPAPKKLVFSAGQLDYVF